jgi:hypothetical protein
MMIYKIALFIFIISAVITGVNDAGIFTLEIPESNINQFDQAQVTDLTDTATGDVNPLFTIQFLMIAVKSIFMGMISVACIIPMLVSLNVPLWLATMIQGPIWFVEAVGLYQVITGIRVED